MFCNVSCDSKDLSEPFEPFTYVYHRFSFCRNNSKFISHACSYQINTHNERVKAHSLWFGIGWTDRFTPNCEFYFHVLHNWKRKKGWSSHALGAFSLVPCGERGETYFAFVPTQKFEIYIKSTRCWRNARLRLKPHEFELISHYNDNDFSILCLPPNSYCSKSENKNSAGRQSKNNQRRDM